MLDKAPTNDRADYLGKHAKRTVICMLNDRWRVEHDGRPGPYTSWELQYRAAPGKWHSKSFCQTREALKRCIHEKAGSCDPVAMAIVATLPARAY